MRDAAPTEGLDISVEGRRVKVGRKCAARALTDGRKIQLLHASSPAHVRL